MLIRKISGSKNTTINLDGRVIFAEPVI